MIKFELELAPHAFNASSLRSIELGGIIHRRRDFINRYGSRAYKTAYCSEWVFDLAPYYKKGTLYSHLCKECLKSYSMEEIKLLKHFLIVQKLKGK